MADIQIPELVNIQDSQRDADDLFMVRDVSDQVDRKISLRQLLNLFKGTSFDFEDHTTLTLGDFGLGGQLVGLPSLAPEYGASGVTNNVNAVNKTGFFYGDGSTVNKPSILSTTGRFHLINLQDLNASSSSQLLFGVQISDGVTNRGQYTNNRLFVKAAGDSVTRTVAYAEETYTATEVNNKLDDLILNKLYPVGSIYMNDTSDVSPATILGYPNTTWEKIQGKVLVGQSTTPASQFSLAKVTVGAETYDYNQVSAGQKGVINTLQSGAHQLTLAETPSHGHGVGSYNVAAVGDHSHTITDPGHIHAINKDTSSASTWYAVDDKTTSVGTQTTTDAIRKAYTGITINGGGGHSHTLTGASQVVGGNGSHSHSLTGTITLSKLSAVQPSYVVYMWRRIS